MDLDRRVIEQRVLAGDRWTIVGSFAEETAVQSRVFPGLSVLPAEVFE